MQWRLLRPWMNTRSCPISARLEEAAADDLRISIDSTTMERLQPYIDLRGYGVAMLEFHNAKLTSYGRMDRAGEPIQLVRDEPQQGGMEMMQ